MSAEDQVGGALGDRGVAMTGGLGVAGGDDRDHRGVGDAQALDADDAQLRGR
jgi:hypothetical protein